MTLTYASMLGRTVDVGGCLEWTGAIDAGGYARINFADENCKASRVAFAIVNGPIPDGLCVLHRCDNRKCINVAHLFLGTHADNWNDCLRKGRANRPVGERNKKAKLTSMAVKAIRLSTVRAGLLSHRYGVSARTINHVRNRKTWRHL